MNLLLIRDKFDENQTIGKLFIDGKFSCYTLEDAVRELPDVPVGEWKIAGRTAIPCGTYPVNITMSNRFKKMMPLLGNVQGFTGVRIHAGNTSADTEGCILLGDVRFMTYIGASRIAVDRVQGMIQKAIKSGDQVFITIQGDNHG